MPGWTANWISRLLPRKMTPFRRKHCANFVCKIIRRKLGSGCLYRLFTQQTYLPISRDRVQRKQNNGAGTQHPSDLQSYRVLLSGCALLNMAQPNSDSCIPKPYRGPKAATVAYRNGFSAHTSASNASIVRRLASCLE